jgi:hypothetical protein
MSTRPRRIKWSRQFNTVLVRYGKLGIIVGLRGRDRPSLYWHWLVYVWQPLRRALGW